ncbi:MAG TPA: hypothetical protein VFA30_04200 [Gaiellaceae bacterium]|nr:hypothetical protein [Gaiellaceae bacterium]
MSDLRHFTVELERPAAGWTELQRAAARARLAAEQMREEGSEVRFLRSVFVPEDDACFFLYSSASAAVVDEAVRRAHLGVRSVGDA